MVVRRVTLRLVSCDVLFFKQKTAYEMCISDWRSDVCSSDLGGAGDADQIVEFPARGFGRLGLGGIDEARARLAVGAGADHGELVRLDRLAGERAFDAGAGLGNLAKRVDHAVGLRRGGQIG